MRRMPENLENCKRRRGLPVSTRSLATERIPGWQGVCRTASRENVKQPERCQWPGGRRTPNGMEGTKRRGELKKDAESADQLEGAPPNGQCALKRGDQCWIGLGAATTRMRRRRMSNDRVRCNVWASVLDRCGCRRDSCGAPPNGQGTLQDLGTDA